MNEIFIGKFEKLKIPVIAKSIILFNDHPVSPFDLFCLSKKISPELKPSQGIRPLKNKSFSSILFNLFKTFLSINLKSETC